MIKLKYSAVIIAEHKITVFNVEQETCPITSEINGGKLWIVSASNETTG